LVEPLSLLISALRLAVSRGAADWEPLFAMMRELERCAADAARGLGKAATEAGIPRQLDLFHLLYKASAWLAHYASSYDAKVDAAAAAQKDFERARRQGNRTASYSACRRRDHARRAAERIIEQYCRLDDLMNQIKRAFDYTTSDGKLNTAAQARPRVAEAIEAIEQTPEGQRLARHLRGAQRSEAFAHLEVLEAGLRTLPLGELGPEPEATAAQMVAQTVAWRRRHKEPVRWLAQAANGSVADHVELAVIRLVDLAVRSSSSVECVNARIRLVQVARKRLSEDFIYLLALHHNMKPFGRGSVREGHTPAELAGIELPTDDWIELLDLTASEPAQGSADAV